MSYFIFTKNFENVEGNLYRIAENKIDLDNLNLDLTHYKLIEDNQIDFNEIKYGNKIVLNYSNNKLNTIDNNFYFEKKQELQFYVNMIKEAIKPFIENNKNHISFSKWNNYYNQLNNLNLDNITYPLNKSLEQYFNDLGQPSYNILQLP